MIALLFLAISGSPLRAAEVECIRQYDGKPFPDEIARKLWPSGFRPVAGMCKFGYLHGTIAKGDYEKFHTLLQINQNTLNVFALASPGGDVDEAILIGRLFRKYLITAWAPSQVAGSFFLSVDPTTLCKGAECVCASACALIWFGAVDRTGVVGLHRPRIEDSTFKALPPHEAAKVYRQVLDGIARYMNEMEAPHPMIDAMVATGSSEILWIYANTDRLEHPPSYAEWENAACGEFTAEQLNSMIDLWVKRDAAPLDANDTLLLKLLEEKNRAVGACEAALHFSHVEQLAPP